MTGGADVFTTLVSVDGLRVGVPALDVDLVAGTGGCAVGVEDLEVVLGRGMEDLAGTVDFVEFNGAREVGVDELEGLDAEFITGLETVVNVDFDAKVNEGLDVKFCVGGPVSVASLDPGTPNDEGL